MRPIFSLVFGLGAALAALAGILAAPILSVSPGMGDKIIIVAFVVIVIGGIGSIKGAFVGALLVGLVDSFGKILFPTVSSLIMYALMAIVLVWRRKAVREAGDEPLGPRITTALVVRIALWPSRCSASRILIDAIRRAS